MVATLTPLTPALVPPSALAGHGALVQFTVADIMAMIDQGIVNEDASTELLNGFVVRTDRGALGGDPKWHSPGHRIAVCNLTDLARDVNNDHQHILIQLPLVCGEMQMPEPDFAIVLGPRNRFINRLPTGSESVCVIEVADSSLERDRDEKYSIYAAAGVPQYVILNLRNRTAEVYRLNTTPASYEMSAVIDERGAIEISLGREESITVDIARLLP